MNQPFDIQVIEHNKQPKSGDCTDNPSIFFTDPIQQIFTFQPVDYIPCRLVGTPFSHRQVSTGLVETGQFVGVDIRLGKFSRTFNSHHARDFFVAADQMANRTMHQKI